MKKFLWILPLMMIVFFSACKKSEEHKVVPLSEYYPLEVGKYVSYQLDSLVFINFGTKDTVITYQVKHEVNAAVTDNLGRPAYRIFRYIRKTHTDPWVSDNTFMAVPTDFSVEFIENNMRFLKMQSPLKNGYTWKGHTYIDTYSLNSEVRYLDNWDYVYDSLGLPTTVGLFNLEDAVKVHHRDEIIGDPSNPDSYSEINRGEEKYAKGIGLIYRNFLHVEYQPPTPGRGGYKQGYGVTLTMIDHN